MIRNTKENNFPIFRTRHGTLPFSQKKKKTTASQGFRLSMAFSNDCVMSVSDTMRITVRSFLPYCFRLK